jgi:hypothetical protein
VVILVGVTVYLPLCRWRAPEVVEEIRRVRASRRGSADTPGNLRAEAGG